MNQMAEAEEESFDEEENERLQPSRKKREDWARKG